VVVVAIPKPHHMTEDAGDKLCDVINAFIAIVAWPHFKYKKPMLDQACAWLPFNSLMARAKQYCATTGDAAVEEEKEEEEEEEAVVLHSEASITPKAFHALATNSVVGACMCPSAAAALCRPPSGVPSMMRPNASLARANGAATVAPVAPVAPLRREARTRRKEETATSNNIRPVVTRANDDEEEEEDVVGVVGVVDSVEDRTVS
jgi:hypothetical protein